MKEVFLKSIDNTKIALNHYNHNSDSVVILCPGWFMTKDSAVLKNITKDFAKHFDVIAMDFRGHGKSGGFYTFTSNEEKDLACVVEYAQQFYKKIYLCGFSLGGALVILHGAKYNNVNKIVAISAPSDFMKIENRMYSPDAWIPTLFDKFEPLRWFTIRAGFPLLKKDRPIDFVDKINVPTMFIAGEKDPTVFPWHTENLYNNAVCKKEYKLFKKTRHAEDLYIDYPQEFIKTCVDWFSD